ncbi:unnamed protein product [Merluccius merluccius]
MAAASQQPLPPSRDRAPKGREEKMEVAGKHAVSGNSTVEPFPQGMETIMFGMGCFWGAEKKFWQKSGVYSTQVGYAGGFTPNATYKEICSGMTGHAEVVRVVFSPEDIRLEELLTVFWENHDPTQGMRQHNDKGSQYRSAIYTSSPSQQEKALKSKPLLPADEKMSMSVGLTWVLALVLTRRSQQDTVVRTRSYGVQSVPALLLLLLPPLLCAHVVPRDYILLALPASK